MPQTVIQMELQVYSYRYKEWNFKKYRTKNKTV